MSAILPFLLFTIVNVQCEIKYQTAINPSQNPHYSRNLQPYQQLRDVGGATVIPGNQQSIDRRLDRTMPGCNPGDIAPAGGDCAAYYECLSGHYKLRYCPTNTFFNPTLKRCHADYVCPNRAHELSTSPPLSPCKRREDLRADKTSCGHSYSSCGDDNRQLERRICPAGKTFDSMLNRCVSDDTTGNRCQQAILQHDFDPRNIAIGLACTENSDSSGYNADPTDCKRYYQCAQGRWIRMQCPSNLVWNPAATVCDWPKNTLNSCH